MMRHNPQKLIWRINSLASGNGCVGKGFQYSAGSGFGASAPVEKRKPHTECCQETRNHYYDKKLYRPAKSQFSPYEMVFA